MGWYFHGTIHHNPRSHSWMAADSSEPIILYVKLGLFFLTCITSHLSTLNFIYFIAQSHSLFRSLCNSSQSASILTTLNNCVSTANLVTSLLSPFSRPFRNVYKQHITCGTSLVNPLCCSNWALTPHLSLSFEEFSLCKDLFLIPRLLNFLKCLWWGRLFGVLYLKRSINLKGGVIQSIGF